MGPSASILREQLLFLYEIEPAAGRLRGRALQARELHELLVRQTEQGRLERPRERQVVARRDQRVEQRHHVLHCGGVVEVGFFGLHARDVQRAQRFFHEAEAVALLREHQHLARRRAAFDLRRHPLRSLGAFAQAQAFLGRVARRRQAVAPFGLGQRLGLGCALRRGLRRRRQRVLPLSATFAASFAAAFHTALGTIFGALPGFGAVLHVARFGVRAGRDRRQAQQPARVARLGAVRAKAARVALRLRGLHDLVHHSEHAPRVAPRVVAAEQVAAERRAHKVLRRDEHLRLGAAKAVDALLGVTHDEHAGRRTAARARVARKPGVQRLPLQRVGVLKFVDEQVAHARVQALLHPAAEHRVGEHALRHALDVVHVHPAARALERGKLRKQTAREPRHALLVLPGRVLAARAQQLLQLGFGFLRRGKFLQVVAQPVGTRHEKSLAQPVQPRVEVCAGQGIDDRGGGFLRRLVALYGKRFRPRLPARKCLGLRERLRGFFERLQWGKHLREMRHRCLHHAGGVGQVELHALGQHCGERLVRLRAPMRGHHGFVVGTQRRVRRDGLQKRLPDLAHGLRVVLEQFEARGQAVLLQHRERRRAQQRGKPAVEGANLHGARALEHLPV
jgi:hypothetical protein